MNRNKIEKEKKTSAQNSIKLGYFQLTTSSFWITVICILCMFIFLQTISTLHIFNRFADKMMKHEEQVIQSLLNRQQP